MTWRQHGPLVAFLIGLSLVAGIGLSGYRTVTRQAETVIWVEHTHRVIERVDDLMLALVTGESAVRGFALSHEERLARELEPAMERAQAAFSDLRALVADNSEQEQRMLAIGPKLERRITQLREHLARVQGGGPNQLLPESLQLSAELRNQGQQIVQQEDRLLRSRVAERNHQTGLASELYGVGFGVSLLAVAASFAFMRREMHARQRTEAELQNKQAQSAWLLELGELLQAAHNVTEAYAVIGRFAPPYFPGEAGAVFALDAERNVVEARCTWGDYPAGAQRLFGPDDCWALRRGRPHGFDRDAVRVNCKHVAEPLPDTSLCVPLLAHGEVAGVLHLLTDQPLRGVQERAAVFGEQLSMALANISLREKLREEAIRDPLTGLYNRRYTRDALERELRRASRNRECVAVLMMDVDHFKRFNDTFGHQAGDHVLQELSTLLTAHTRGSDVVSRMGGEELLAILPGAQHEDSLQKAEQLRSVIARSKLSHAGNDLGPLTVSIGVAVYPQHGVTADLLLRAADAALYRAKGAGRDCVVLAA